MVRQLKLEYGDEIPTWNTEDKINEWHRRIEEVKKELAELLEGKKYVCFLMRRAYSHSYSLSTKIEYKQTFLGWRHTPVGDLPKYKPHYIYFKLGRAKLYDSEQIAFMDMKKGFIRETDKPLTPYEKIQKEKGDLEVRVRELEAEKEFEKSPKEEVEKKEIKKEIKNASAKGKIKGKKTGTKSI